MARLPSHCISPQPSPRDLQRYLPPRLGLCATWLAGLACVSLTAAADLRAAPDDSATAAADSQIATTDSPATDSPATDSPATEGSAASSTSADSQRVGAAAAVGESAHAQQVASARDLSAAFRTAAARMIPCVVTIKARTRQSGNSGVADIVGAENFDSVGSGVILAKEGLILTNHHVIEKAVHIEVRLHDGRQFEASDPRSDARSDLAVLKIDVGEDLPVAELGDPNELSVGDWVLAIGSPFNLEATVSAGIISAKHSKLDGLVSGRILQTDAAINPGNSGGPLIDLDGRVVGINTAISTTTGSFQGIGFAIPVNRAVWVKNELLERNRVRRGVLGVSTQNLPYDIARQLNLPLQGGAYVTSTVRGRPGERAGLLAGDIIVELDGQRVVSGADLASVVEESPIGRPIDLTILRAGERMKLSVVLDARD
jgi:serine protease Do